MALGFASGLPLSLTTDALQAWLKDAGVDIASIGALGFVSLPYGIKFLWAPLMDRYVPSALRLGRRRGWLVVIQFLLAGTIAALALCRPESRAGLLAVGAVALMIAFFSASQDTVTDAYRTDVLPPEERGAGVAVSIMGYRMGALMSGAGALYLVGRFGLSWPITFLVLAGMMLLCIVASILAPAPASEMLAPPRTLRDAVIGPMNEMLARGRAGWIMLAMVFVFKVPEYMAGSLTVPFLLDSGVSKADLATIKQIMGTVVVIAGAISGGVIVNRIRVGPSLWLFGVLHSVSNLSFLLVARDGGHAQFWHVAVAVAVENFCIGLTTAGFLPFLMAQCDPRFSATQYALLSGIMALGRVAASTPAGFIAGHTGWTIFFLISAVSGLPGLALLPFLDLREKIDQPVSVD